MKKIIYCLFVIGLLITTGCSNKDILKGEWVASIDNQRVYQIDDETVGGKEEYFLNCDGKGYYELNTKTRNLAAAGYKITNNKVTFYDEGREILAICKIKDKELDCSEESYYAIKYTRK